MASSEDVFSASTTLIVLAEIGLREKGQSPNIPFSSYMHKIVEDACCDTPASPSCGACLGGPKVTYARMNEPKNGINVHQLVFIGGASP
ncbi:hypothetical protein ACS0TY_011593 [Phlomoides rotata]